MSQITFYFSVSLHCDEVGLVISFVYMVPVMKLVAYPVNLFCDKMLHRICKHCPVEKLIRLCYAEDHTVLNYLSIHLWLGMT